MINVEVIETSALGDRSYVASDGEVAVVVDPQRDVDRVLAVAGRLNVHITHVVETHVHNDYVSGGLELARLTGAEYAMSAGDELGFPCTRVTDGDVLEASPQLRLRVLATPGHTFHHLSYVLEGEHGVEGVFTGGSLLYGTTGRTDLLGDEHAETLAREQHSSARALADLPDGAQVWPTHGFGSFCTASAASQDASTIGEQKEQNPVLRLERDDYVRDTLAGLGAYPAYYAHMGALNAAGPAPIDLSAPNTADPTELAKRLAAGEWVVDLRSRKAFYESHLAGAVSLGLDGPMATWLGWMSEHGAPITLVGETRVQVTEAQRELTRIGIDRIAAAATGRPESLAADPGQLAELPAAGFADLAASMGGDGPADLPAADVVLDVRLGNEWDVSHVLGAIHIPLPEVAARLDEIPSGSIWVHCGSGYRAAAAASLLARAGRTAVVIDDSFDDAGAAGVSLTES